METIDTATLQPLIRISRVWEDSQMTRLEFYASNDNTAVQFEYYTGFLEEAELADALKTFPKSVNDSFVSESGELQPDSGEYQRIELGLVDTLGHCFISIRFNNNEPGPDNQEANFSIKTEPARLNKLGQMLTTFITGSHQRLIWSHDGDSDTLE